MSRPLTDHEWRRLELAWRLYYDPAADAVSMDEAFTVVDEWIAAARLDAPTEGKPDLVVEGQVVKDPVVRDFMLLHEGPSGLPDTFPLPDAHRLVHGARYRVTFTKLEGE